MIINREGNGRIKQQYNDEDFIELCKEYKVKRNAKEIANREGIPLVTLYYYIKKLGYNKPRRKYEFNQSYFKNINTKNKAYILGFLMADGCVCKSTSDKTSPDRLIIQISYKDRSILEFIQKELGSNYKIKDFIPNGTYSNNMMSSLIINSTELCTDLIKYGVVPNKTGKESFPKLRENLKRHFIRGFLDGDGWITSNNTGSTTIGFISNYTMLESIKSEINKSLNIKSTARIYNDYRSDKNIYYLEYSHRDDIEQLKKYLYHNAEFYLERKASKLT